MNRRNGFSTFLVFAKIFKKTCVGAVVDYADTVSAWSLTTLTRCWRGTVVENTDTLSANP